MTNSPVHERALFAFWIYILGDCVLFASLFATFAVLRGATFGGPRAEDLLNLPFVLAETVALLTSSYVFGIALVKAQQAKPRAVVSLLAVALALGLVFLGLEVSEFAKLIGEGHGPATSGFLSAFFILVGTHGLHVLVGSIWMLTLIIQIPKGLGERTYTKLSMLGMFWHFLDIIWICIFTLVYLLSATL